MTLGMTVSTSRIRAARCAGRPAQCAPPAGGRGSGRRRPRHAPAPGGPGRGRGLATVCRHQRRCASNRRRTWPVPINSPGQAPGHAPDSRSRSGHPWSRLEGTAGTRDRPPADCPAPCDIRMTQPRKEQAMDEQVRREALFWLGDRGESARAGARSADPTSMTSYRWRSQPGAASAPRRAGGSQGARPPLTAGGRHAAGGS